MAADQPAIAERARRYASGRAAWNYCTGRWRPVIRQAMSRLSTPAAIRGLAEVIGPPGTARLSATRGRHVDPAKCAAAGLGNRRKIVFAVQRIDSHSERVDRESSIGWAASYAS